MCDPNSMQGVLTQFLDDYQHTHRMNLRQHKICGHMSVCRTEALGGIHLNCNQCDYSAPQYHSCRDRHCPRCQRRASADWCERQQQSILPVTYYHVVFTLPHALNPWVQLHPEVIYGLLFQVVWATLEAFGGDPKRLGGELGMTAVLHTWGQTLGQHVHLHCLIPGGVWTEDGRWRSAKSNYLFPVKALSRHFRGRMVSALRKADENGELSRITRAGEVDGVLNRLMATDWVVYSKACLNRTESVVSYLAQYSHRIAISDWRILGIDSDQVNFRYKDYRDHNRKKVMSLAGVEFIRRFLLHVLPKGLMRIRHYGFLANRCRVAKLKTIRDGLAAGRQPDVDRSALVSERSTPPGVAEYPCPKCRQGHLQALFLIRPKPLTGG